MSYLSFKRDVLKTIDERCVAPPLKDTIADMYRVMYPSNIASTNVNVREKEGELVNHQGISNTLIIAYFLATILLLVAGLGFGICCGTMMERKRRDDLAMSEESEVDSYDRDYKVEDY